MRQTILKLTLALMLGGAAMPVVLAQSAKRPLDIEGCMRWKRVDSPEISPSGRWVSYRIGLMEYNPDSKESRITHLYDTRTGKEMQLEDVSNLEYFDGDRQLAYQLSDSTGARKTMLMQLPSGAKREWPYPESFRPAEGTPYSVSVTGVPADTVRHIPAFDRLVVRHIATGEAFHIDSVGYHTLYNQGRSILFVREGQSGNALCYGPLKGPYTVLYQSEVPHAPSFFAWSEKRKEGEFCVDDSLWYSFSLADRKVRLVFDRKELLLPAGLEVSRVDLSKSRKYLTLELRPVRKEASASPKKPAQKKNEDFELELWTWDEYEVPTLQTSSRYVRAQYPKYIYDIATRKLTEVAPPQADLLEPHRADELHHVLYTDETPYRMQKEWLEQVPFDVYSVNVHTGEKRVVGRRYRTAPKWSSNGRWAVMYDPIAQAWNKFDAVTGQVTDISAAIGHPVHNERYDKPAPAPAYGLAGWTADGNNVFICDAYDWWKIDLTGKREAECFTKGYGRRSGKSIRKMTSNIDKDLFEPDDKIMVSLWDVNTMDEQVCLLDMKGGLKKLTEGPYRYTLHSFSGNQKYCLWTRQNVRESRDLWWSTADFRHPVRITDANPQQSEYKWGDVRLVEWTNYENKPNKGLLYLPEDYEPGKEYPVLVQFYETHTEEIHNYPAPMLSSAMADVMYFVSNGYIVFMPDVHFTVGNPGQSSYDAVVSGTEYLIKQGIVRPGKIGLQGHSWSGYQTAYLVTKTDLFACANIGAPITDMVTGYLGIRNGSGLPRYFMYEETQSRMGSTLWEAKEKYLASSAILEADKIHTPLLIWHNDRDEAVAYEQGRALYLAMRRLQRPAWHLNYKGEGHFLGNQAAQKDWTVRMMQFFDYYLKDTGMPRWMKEGIHLRDRGYDQKYDLLNK